MKKIDLDSAVTFFRNIILDEMTQYSVNTWVAGGAVRDYFMGQPNNTDIDLYFPSHGEYLKACKYIEDRGGKVTWESENGVKFRLGKYVFDLIKIYFKSPQATIDCFDFNACCFAVDDEQVYHSKDAFFDLTTRNITIQKLPFPTASLRRAFRYYKKGFRLPSEEMNKLIEAVKDDKTESISDTGKESSANSMI